MIYDLLVLLNVLIFYIRYTVSGSKKTEHSMTLCLNLLGKLRYAQKWVLISIKHISYIGKRGVY